MKITFISEYFPYLDRNFSGGVENRCYNLAKNLALSNEVNVITSWKKGQERNHILDSINVHRVGPNHKYSNDGQNITRFLFAISAFKKAKEIKSEVIDSQSFISSLPAYYAAKSQKSKPILTSHESWIGDWIKVKGFFTGVFGEIWERISLSKKWYKIIAVSNFTQKKLTNSGLKEESIIKIYNGIDLKSFEHNYSKYEIPTICCISRLTPNKRVNDLILAIKEVKNKINNIKCIIIGDGPEKESLQNLIIKYNLQENIEIKGYIHNQELKEILAKSQVLCLPSILEGFGIVILEAIASKTPYVCTEIEVLKEITEDFKGGLSFKEKNVGDLSDKLIELILNKKTYKSKLIEGKNLIKKYDWKNISKQYENLINN